jgi:hypothetical protein
MGDIPFSEQILIPSAEEVEKIVYICLQICMGSNVRLSWLVHGARIFHMYGRTACLWEIEQWALLTAPVCDPTHLECLASFEQCVEFHRVHLMPTFI